MSTNSKESLDSSGEKRRPQEQNSLRVSEEDDENKGNFSIIAQMTPSLDPMMDKSGPCYTQNSSLYTRRRKMISSFVF